MNKDRPNKTLLRYGGVDMNQQGGSWTCDACKRAQALAKDRFDAVLCLAADFALLRKARVLALCCVLVAVLGFSSLVPAVVYAGGGFSDGDELTDEPSWVLGVNDFNLAAEQGFGDRQNSVVWSMLWWPKTGKLYVGTNRSWLCWSYAGTVATYPLLSYLYPPRDPCVECAEDYNDLPLQAEIWAWDPQTDTWERVFQSPQDVPIPGSEKFVARDIAFRSMSLFTEPDGTEAMYVTGTSSKPIHKDVPPPRILRTTDGINFEPIPQDPGTFMGELPKASFRSLTPYNGRLYVIHGSVQGNGIILESADPSAGNDAWRQVSPEYPELRVFELQEYNGFLYVGAVDMDGGYSVLKTDATGEPPYTFTPVVTNGGFLPAPSKAVVSMHVFNGRLYVGTDGPAELIRINRDDSWDLIVGTPRLTPQGFKYPLSGLDEGFSFSLNEHIWRMEHHHGVLYIGTYDASTTQHLCPGKEQVLHDRMGFDLYSSEDGVHFSAVTLDGFGDPYDFGVRTFESTPYGLFFGTANYYFGAKVYRGTHGGGTGLRGTSTAQSDQLEPPGGVLATAHRQGVRLTWTAAPRAVRYLIFRSTFTQIHMNIPGGVFPPWLDPYQGCYQDVEFDAVLDAVLAALSPELRALLLDLMQNQTLLAELGLSTVFPGLPDRPGQLTPLPGAEIGITGGLSFVDTTIQPGVTYSYYVVAENRHGDRSGSSNAVTFPLE